MRGDEAVVELAVASGLALVPAGRRDALAASSRGTGELITAALDAGATRIVLAIGGSASTDGGAGLIAALGARLLNASGAELAEGGGALREVATVDLSGLDPRVARTRFVLVCDVDHVLLGPAPPRWPNRTLTMRRQHAATLQPSAHRPTRSRI